MTLDRLEPGRRDVVDRRGEAGGLGEGGRPGLELVRHLVERGLLEPDRADHLAAEVEGAHLVEQLPAPPERPDSGRAADLVSRDRHEVGPERLDVDRAVRCRLRSVDDHDRALRVRPLGELLDRVDRAERVRDEVVGDDLHVSLAGKPVEGVELELALVVDRDVAEARSGAARDVLPRHEVGVVLELGDHHEVARAEVVETPGVGDEVQGLRRVPGEDDLLLARCVEEGRHRAARTLERLGRPLGEPVDAAMDVRVLVLVEPAHPVEHLTRLLTRGGRVEVRDRLPVEELLEDREIGPQAVGVENGCRRRAHVVHRSRALPGHPVSDSKSDICGYDVCT